MKPLTIFFSIVGAGLVLIVAAYSVEYYLTKQILIETDKQMRKSLATTQQTTSSIMKSATVPRERTEKIKVWVPGKPISKCVGPSRELNDEVNRCVNGYYVEQVVLTGGL